MSDDLHHTGKANEGRTDAAPETLFTSAEWYERSINWVARLGREIPVLVDLFGRPGEGGILDAGCGTGNQACALAQCGYRVVGADASEEMLEIARQRTGVPLAKKQTPLPSPLSKGGNRAGDPADTNTSLPSPLGKEGNCAGDSADTNARLPSALSKSGNREGDGGAGMTTPVEFVHSAYATLFEKVGGGFDGVYCIGNSLAASGTREDARGGLEQFAKCLRTGGRLFVQILNFPIMRLDRPCVRGPRITKVEGTEYVSVRHFVFRDDHVEVNNITLFQDDGWRYRAHTGRLYPITIAELGEWCGACELRIDETWGSYGREPFDPGVSVDLIIAATRA